MTVHQASFCFLINFFVDNFCCENKKTIWTVCLVCLGSFPDLYDTSHMRTILRIDRLNQCFSSLNFLLQRMEEFRQHYKECLELRCFYLFFVPIEVVQCPSFLKCLSRISKMIFDYLFLLLDYWLIKGSRGWYGKNWSSLVGVHFIFPFFYLTSAYGKVYPNRAVAWEVG